MNLLIKAVGPWSARNIIRNFSWLCHWFHQLLTSERKERTVGGPVGVVSTGYYYYYHIEQIPEAVVFNLQSQLALASLASLIFLTDLLKPKHLWKSLIPFWNAKQIIFHMQHRKQIANLCMSHPQSAVWKLWCHWKCKETKQLCPVHFELEQFSQRTKQESLERKHHRKNGSMT